MSTYITTLLLHGLWLNCCCWLLDCCHHSSTDQALNKCGSCESLWGKLLLTKKWLSFFFFFFFNGNVLPKFLTLINYIFSTQLQCLFLMKITCRFINPIVIAPVTAIVGLGLLEYGFPGVLLFLISSFQPSSSWYPVFSLRSSDSCFVYFIQPEWSDWWLTIYNRNFPCFSCLHQVGKCVEIGIPALLFILIFSQVIESWARKQMACCWIVFWVSVLITLCTVAVACLVLSLSFGILPSSPPA